MIAELLEPTLGGLKSLNPEMQIIAIQNKGAICVFDPSIIEEIIDAVELIRKESKTITYVYGGDVGDILNIPDVSTRNGKKWIGYARHFNTLDPDASNAVDIKGDNLLKLIHDIPIKHTEFMIHRS